MQRIQYHRYGGPEQMRLEEVALSEPRRGQVRVRIKAAGVNPADGKVRAGALRLVSGPKFPRGMGHDFAGVIDALGPGATKHRIGDEVFGISGIRAAGAFADYLTIGEDEAYAKPASVPFEQAAAIPMASVTSWSAVVDRARVRAGQAVFVAGCLGGLGRAAVQLALMRGAQVAASCSAAGRDEALALGVSEVADYRDFDAAAFANHFDLVFDTAGGLTRAQCEAMLKPGGVAVHAVPSPGNLLASLISSKHAIASGRPTPARMAGVAEAAEQGALAPKIGRVVPLSEAIAALTEQETTGLPKAKLVIVPAP